MRSEAVNEEDLPTATEQNSWISECGHNTGKVFRETLAINNAESGLTIRTHC